MSVRILTGDTREVLRALPSGSVHTIVTSPPYFGLRSYLPDGHPDKAKEIGLEPTPDAFVAELVAVFRECKRVLRDDGTLWLNLGDSYATGAGAVGNSPGGGAQGEKWKQRGRMTAPNRMPLPGLKPKDLIGIPWLVAFALRADGWYLRSDIIWSKPNPMPESVRDRPTKAHEYLFLLSKSERYYFDQEAVKENGSGRIPGNRVPQRLDESHGDEGLRLLKAQQQPQVDRNIRTVWTVPTSPFPGAHFATFPPDLIEPCIKAGTSEKGCCAKCGAPWVRDTAVVGRVQSATGTTDRPESINARGGHVGTTSMFHDGKVGVRATLGWSPLCSCDAGLVPCTVLDCFGGAGTTGLVADRLQRNAILIELNPDYAEMARRRLVNDAPLFVEAAE